jgi:hypothetical protein
VKFETTPRFDKDVKVLAREHRGRFRALVQDFSAACDVYVEDPGGFVWPAHLRVSRMTSVPGVWEMTWFFASPDGRATFEFVTVDGEARVRWRRIGNHRIYQEP